MRLANLAQSGIGEHVLHALTERSPCFLRHSALDHVLVGLDLLVDRIGLDLIDHRGDLVESNHVGQTVRIEIAHANCADHTVLVELFERAPCAVGIGERLVQQHEVEIVSAELLQGHVDGLQRILIAVVADPDLGGEEQFLAIDAGILDALTDFGLIEI